MPLCGVYGLYTAILAVVRCVLRAVVVRAWYMLLLLCVLCVWPLYGSLVAVCAVCMFLCCLCCCEYPARLSGGVYSAVLL